MSNIRKKNIMLTKKRSESHGTLIQPPCERAWKNKKHALENKMNTT
jgi:hypothetical protein